MKNVGACPGGITAAGLAGRPMGLRFRDAFLGTVAAGALSLALSGPALAGPAAGRSIDGTGTIETCTGDQSHGDFLRLAADGHHPQRQQLDPAITPASGTDGISFISTGAITITSNTGAFGITTSNAYGIDATAGAGGDGDLDRQHHHRGTNASGIFASGAGSVTVTSTGNITTAGQQRVRDYCQRH